MSNFSQYNEQKKKSFLSATKNTIFLQEDAATAVLHTIIELNWLEQKQLKSFSHMKMHASIFPFSLVRFEYFKPEMYVLELNFRRV